MSTMASQGFQPYQFDPVYDADRGSDESTHDSSMDTSSSDSLPDLVAAADPAPDNGQDWRLTNTLWCSCGCCVIGATAKECVCCQELQQCAQKMEENTKCITQHPAFEPVCLLRDVLRTALVARNDIRRDNLREPLSNETLRLSAYRQFTYWVHQRLGRHVRRVVPSCVVEEIRKAYPDPQGQYRGFLEHE